VVSGKKPVLISVLICLMSAGIAGKARYHEPARAGQWMVASGHPLATRAGLEMLEDGGKACDAAVVTLPALEVTRFLCTGADPREEALARGR